MCIKQRKAVEAVVAKRNDALFKVENIILRIGQAESDIQVMTACGAGVDTLKTLLSHEAVLPESIDKVTTEMEEAFDVQADIEHAMTFANQRWSETDEDSLNAEVDDLIQQSLPSVPNKSVPVSKEADDVSTVIRHLESLDVSKEKASHAGDEEGYEKEEEEKKEPNIKWQAMPSRPRHSLCVYIIITRLDYSTKNPLAMQYTVI